MIISGEHFNQCTELIKLIDCSICIEKFAKKFVLNIKRPFYFGRLKNFIGAQLKEIKFPVDSISFTKSDCCGISISTYSSRQKISIYSPDQIEKGFYIVNGSYICKISCTYIIKTIDTFLKLGEFGEVNNFREIPLSVMFDDTMCYSKCGCTDLCYPFRATLFAEELSDILISRRDITGRSL